MSAPGTRRLMSDNRVAGYKIGGDPLNQQIVMYDSTTEKFIFAAVGSANILLSSININADKNWNVKSITNFGIELSWFSNLVIGSISDPVFVNTVLLDFAILTAAPAGRSLRVNFQDRDLTIQRFSLYGGDGVLTGTITDITQQLVGTNNLQLELKELFILPVNDTGGAAIWEINMGTQLGNTILPITTRSLFEIRNDNTEAMTLLLSSLEVYGERVFTQSTDQKISLNATQTVINGATEDISSLTITLPNMSSTNGRVMIVYNLTYESVGTDVRLFTIFSSPATGVGEITKVQTLANDRSSTSYSAVFTATGQIIKLSVRNASGESIRILGADGTGGVSYVQTYGIG